jgi:energy-coupling factor transporter transmembrane protein EcfT
MITATLLHTNISLLIFDSFILLGLFILSGLNFKHFFRDFKMWAIFLLGLFLFQAFFSSGPRLTLLPWLPISKDGIRLGSLTCWRLGLILGFALLFTAVNRPRELRDALIWIFKPFPFLPGRRIGLMVSLTLQFFSRTLDQAEEVRLAHRARLGDLNKNPFRKVKFLALPLLRRSFSQVEEVTFALAARGFRDDLPIQLPKIPLSHLIPLILLLGSLIVIGWLQV